MEQYAKQCNKEYMKMAMLKQEDTFKHQVHELHRLYKIQSMLMRDVKNVMKEQSPNIPRKCMIWSAENVTGRNQPSRNFSGEMVTRKMIDLELPAQEEEYTGNGYESLMPETDEESNLELTLATGSKRSRTKKESSITSDSASSFSTISIESKVSKVDSNGRGEMAIASETKRLKTDWQFEFETKEQIRQDGLKQTPWLLQCSLNLTS